MPKNTTRGPGFDDVGVGVSVIVGIAVADFVGVGLRV
jgi:hypothetical protein